MTMNDKSEMTERKAVVAHFNVTEDNREIYKKKITTSFQTNI